MLTFAAFVQSVRDLFAAFAPGMVTLVALMVMDFVMGVCNAWVTKTVNSSASFRGTVKKAMMLIGLSALIIVAPLTHWGMAAVVMVFFLGTELISIFENLGRAGVKLPAKLIATLVKLRDGSKDFLTVPVAATNPTTITVIPVEEKAKTGLN